MSVFMEVFLLLHGSVSAGKPDPKRSLSGRVQDHSEDDWKGNPGHWPRPVHEVGTEHPAQVEVWLQKGEGGVLAGV